jgi:AraC-like DNA-binding protein
MKMFRDPEVVSGLTLENPFAGFHGITHCGEALCSRSHRLPAHRHTGIELTYLVFGEVTWKVENRLLRQAAGELSVINAGRPHSTAPGNHPEFKAFCIGLDLREMGCEGASLQKRLDARAAINFGFAPEFEPILRSLMQQAMFPFGSGSRIARKFAELLVAMLDSRLAEKRSRSASPGEKVFSLPVQKAVHYLEHQLARRVPVGELARVANLGSSHFSVCFRREVGMTPGAYHRNLRLQAARAALGMPDYSMTHIAQEMGFSSSQHFSTLFRRAFGCSPRQWRKRELSRSGGSAVV